MLSRFRAYILAVQYYRQCEKLKVPGFLKDQLLRASSSIVLNTAEGSGKPTPKEKMRFYGIALGSLRESESILDISNQTCPETRRLAYELGGCLYVLSHGRRSKAQAS